MERGRDDAGRQDPGKQEAGEVWGVLPGVLGFPRGKSPSGHQVSKPARGPAAQDTPHLNTAESPISLLQRGCGAELLGRCGGGEEVGTDLDQGRGWGFTGVRELLLLEGPRQSLCKAAWLAQVQHRAVRLRAWSALPGSRSGPPDPGPSGKGWCRPESVGTGTSSLAECPPLVTCSGHCHGPQIAARTAQLRLQAPPPDSSEEPGLLLPHPTPHLREALVLGPTLSLAPWETPNAHLQGGSRVQMHVSMPPPNLPHL